MKTNQESESNITFEKWLDLLKKEIISQLISSDFLSGPNDEKTCERLAAICTSTLSEMDFGYHHLKKNEFAEKIEEHLHKLADEGINLKTIPGNPVYTAQYVARPTRVILTSFMLPPRDRVTKRDIQSDEEVDNNLPKHKDKIQRLPLRNLKIKNKSIERW